MDDINNLTDLCCSSSLVHRLKYGGGHKKQAIARAVGTSNNKCLKVIDATCGLGTDAIILAYFNCKVYAIEKHPVIKKLAENRFLKAKENSFLAPVIKNITLFHGDCLEIIPYIIKKILCFPDVIYLDPMFNKQSTAAPNKLIKVVKSILNNKNNNSDLEYSKLLKFSLKYVARRVVVKRPRTGQYLSETKPNFSLIGKANRFDVYLP